MRSTEDLPSTPSVRGLAFHALRAVLRRVGAKGVLHRGVEPGELRRRVGDRVVDEFVAEGHDLEAAADVAPTAGERAYDVAEAGVGAVAAHHRAHAAEGEKAEVALKEKARFAAEEAIALAHRARVGTEAVFKDEPHLRAAAEVFRALDAEARTDPLAGLHGKGRGRLIGDATAVRPVEAVVEDAVNFDVGSKSSAGKSGGNHGASKENALHDEILLVCKWFVGLLRG